MNIGTFLLVVSEFWPEVKGHLFPWADAAINFTPVAEALYMWLSRLQQALHGSKLTEEAQEQLTSKEG